MGRHSKRSIHDAEVSRRVLLSALVGGVTVAGVTVATSGKLYTTDELDRELAQAAPRELTQVMSPATSSAPAPTTTSSAPSTSAAPTTTSSAPTRAAPTTEPPAPVVTVSEQLAEQPRTGWGLQPLAAASTHLISMTFGITTIGGYRASSEVAGSDHPKGLAADFMTMNHKLNRGIASFAVANRSLLRVKYVISLQEYNDGSGWEPMEDRGSITANHFDHCHISFY